MRCVCCVFVIDLEAGGDPFRKANRSACVRKQEMRAVFFLSSDLRLPCKRLDSVTGLQWEAKYNIGCPVWSAFGRPGRWDVGLDLVICHQ